MAEATGTYGFIGMGNMGQAMALNLQKHFAKQQLPSLLVWNRSADKCKPVVEAGGKQTNSVTELVKQSDVVFVSLANDQVVLQVYEEILQATKSKSSDLMIIETSTLYPDTVKDLARRCQEAAESGKKCEFLSMQVFGATAAAQAAQLILAPAGSQQVLEKIRPHLVPVIGRAILELGEDPSTAAKTKLVGNFFIVSVIEALAEGMTLGEKSGVPREKLKEFIDLMFPFGSYNGYSGKIAEDSFEKDVGFAVDLGLKDVGHMRRLAQEYQCPLPLADLAFQHLLSAKANGRSDQDWSSLVTSLRAAAGMPPTGANDKKPN
ncbi:hypothetical protein K493DRAFT_313948 [Basidiobolus meristosporus CBS 931.73]|uniref:NAD(P)-binding protein n=1 Tax=Basidiobolus meristosporus CBS 931.73 TaxID=1314790 RepID=A0A1Y1YIL3_9FUNG|nr:hypothetical protein K493DRAFT_313948 [Basidiobolus meristosporus CBS 931.73]|eukprot:ORX97703.1 hypothetical protein K493DRAFT_313948 [Basidiobolus meristosporus CBS 931.73]